MASLSQQHWSLLNAATDRLGKQLDPQIKPKRQEVMQQVASSALSVEDGLCQWEEIRWIQRINLHLARLSDHLVAASLLGDQ